MRLKNVWQFNNQGWNKQRCWEMWEKFNSVWIIIKTMENAWICIKMITTCLSKKTGVHIYHLISSVNPSNHFFLLFTFVVFFPWKRWQKNELSLTCQSADGLRHFRKLWFLYHYANYLPRLGSSLAESQSISYFSPDVRTPIKLSNAF